MGSYVISDIHGCYDELIRMLEKINLEDSDTLICAGDYVDKGPKNAEVLEWIMNVPPNVILLRGNHDEDFAQNIEAMRIISYKMDLDRDSLQDSEKCRLATAYLLIYANYELAVIFYYLLIFHMNAPPYLIFASIQIFQIYLLLWSDGLLCLSPSILFICKLLFQNHKLAVYLIDQASLIYSTCELSALIYNLSIYYRRVNILLG